MSDTPADNPEVETDNADDVQMNDVQEKVFEMSLKSNSGYNICASIINDRS